MILPQFTLIATIKFLNILIGYGSDYTDLTLNHKCLHSNCTHIYCKFITIASIQSKWRIARGENTCSTCFYSVHRLAFFPFWVGRHLAFQSPEICAIF